ncbi:MAG: CDP-glycerol glycerophosphotransferase family protein, partial [Eubacterium sp.]|nr:CDP-glycerol glycerophosphotransferase family protein [Eubacterium sp.]
EKLLNMGADVRICWILRSQKKAIDGIDIVYEGDWKRYIYEMETAKVWIMDEPVPEYIFKRKDQIYIQTKHWGSITLKKFYFDVDRQSEKRKKKLEHGFAGIDYIFVGSDFDENSCRSGFHYSGECVHIGSPRSDVMFDMTVKKKVRYHYKLSEDKRIILYAPTYREVRGKNIRSKRHWNEIDLRAIRNAVAAKFGGEWVVLLHLHPLDASYAQGVRLEEGIIDASLYENSQELVASADMMITDYSSVMFEPAIVGKPVFLYAPDQKEYVFGDRGFLIDYNSLPFPVSESMDELLSEINRFVLDNYQKRVKVFLGDHGVSEDGNASMRAAEFILKKLGQGSN